MPTIRPKKNWKTTWFVEESLRLSDQEIKDFKEIISESFNRNSRIPKEEIDSKMEKFLKELSNLLQILYEDQKSIIESPKTSQVKQQLLQLGQSLTEVKTNLHEIFKSIDSKTAQEIKASLMLAYITPALQAESFDKDILSFGIAKTLARVNLDQGVMEQLENIKKSINEKDEELSRVLRNTSKLTIDQIRESLYDDWVIPILKPQTRSLKLLIVGVGLTIKRLTLNSKINFSDPTNNFPLKQGRKRRTILKHFALELYKLHERFNIPASLSDQGSKEIIVNIGKRNGFVFDRMLRESLNVVESRLDKRKRRFWDDQPIRYLFEFIRKYISSNKFTRGS